MQIFLTIIFWEPAALLLLNVPCDAPFIVLFNIVQLRRSRYLSGLSRAERGIALLYGNNFIRLINLYNPFLLERVLCLISVIPKLTT